MVLPTSYCSFVIYVVNWPLLKQITRSAYRSDYNIFITFFFRVQAIENLMNFPTRQTMMAFIDIAKQKECFYKVRQNAIERLAKVTL